MCTFKIIKSYVFKVLTNLRKLWDSLWCTWFQCINGFRCIRNGAHCNELKKIYGRRQQKKLDGAGVVDNRPSTDKPTTVSCFYYIGLQYRNITNKFGILPWCLHSIKTGNPKKIWNILSLSYQDRGGGIIGLAITTPLGIVFHASKLFVYL